MGILGHSRDGMAVVAIGGWTAEPADDLPKHGTII